MIDSTDKPVMLACALAAVVLFFILFLGV